MVTSQAFGTQFLFQIKGFPLGAQLQHKFLPAQPSYTGLDSRRVSHCPKQVLIATSCIFGLHVTKKNLHPLHATLTEVRMSTSSTTITSLSDAFRTR